MCSRGFHKRSEAQQHEERGVWYVRYCVATAVFKHCSAEEDASAQSVGASWLYVAWTSCGDCSLLFVAW
jgi:hypothetical protein